MAQKMQNILKNVRENEIKVISYREPVAYPEADESKVEAVVKIRGKEFKIKGTWAFGGYSTDESTPKLDEDTLSTLDQFITDNYRGYKPYG